jgi:two-component system chemotaxis sensor kinase CheA
MYTSNDILEQLRDGFKAEVLDLLVELDSAILELESKPNDLPLVHRIFRAIHTIKGSSGVAGFGHLAAFTHKVEETFELARAGKISVTPELIDCALRSCDVIRLILDQSDEGTVSGEAEIAGALTELLGNSNESPDSKPPVSAPASTRTAYEIIFKPNREVFYSGIDPVTLLDELRELGQTHITAHTEGVLALSSLEIEHCYLWWEILLVTTSDLAKIHEVFVFVEEDCDVRIRSLDEQTGAVALLGSVPAETLELFQIECQEQLETIEDAALALENHRQPGKDLDALFRGVHNIKGNTGVMLGQIEAGALGATHPLRLLHQITHALESLLDPFRSGSLGPIPEQLAQTAIETCDAIQALLRSLTHQKAGAGNVPSALLKNLGIQSLDHAPENSASARAAAFYNTTSQWVEMIAGCFARLNTDTVPPGSVLETYRRGVKTLASAAQYQNFSELAEPLALQLRILDDAMRSGRALGGEDRSALGTAFDSVCSILNRLGRDAEAQPRAVISTALPAANEAQSERAGSAGTGATVRIDQDKLDRLMRVAGELLVARGAFPILVDKLNNGAEITTVAKELKDAGSNISRITDDLQASIMSIRMLPAKTVFQKFPRLVRDLARALGKEVRLVIEGEGTELDKTILEQIGDPLIHVIRNAVDHGLEQPPVRVANGKNPCGQLKVRASNEAGGVLIEISDDGQGLDAAALKRKAVERGLISADAAAAMSPEAAFQLIFMPGLSTAEKVTDVSGRGVGMDVVRSNVRNLNGTIDIRSKRGQGTTFMIKLPTSLMISKGILLEAGEQEYILPLGTIRDMVKIPREAAHNYKDVKLAQIRGNTFPLIALADTLGLKPADKPEISVALLEVGNFKYGLVVDRFVSEVEVLIKPLTGGLKGCREFQGAAIMGDGRVVLVLNALECHTLQKSQAAAS